MAEKKPVKKTIAKHEEKKPASVGDFGVAKEEIKTPVIAVAHNAADDLADEEISKEIAEAIRENTGKADRYFEAIGRRKTAVARVRLFTKGDKEFLVNDVSFQKYFDMAEDQENAVASMK